MLAKLFLNCIFFIQAMCLPSILPPDIACFGSVLADFCAIDCFA